MKNGFITSAAALAVCACAQKGDHGHGHWNKLPPVSSENLQALISIDELVAGEQQLQNFAYAYPGGNRVFGSPGHNDTVFFLYDTLKATGYYDVSLQEFVELFSGGDATLTTNGEEQEPDLLTYTPSGSATAPLVAVNNLGCLADDFPPEVEGSIALISRRECTFAEKATYALSAGAVGAIVYNNVEGSLAGTLGGVGEYPPSVGITQEAGEALLALIEAGTVVEAELEVNAVLENRTTHNVIAETKGGDHDNVIALGAHTDSVEAGPGINDDGSGTIGILNVAVALSYFSVTNAVRFLFWTAEDFGLLGSTYYVSQLNESAPAELEKIHGYLNFDMIASPNYAYLAYDGDGSSINLSGPPGSAEIEKKFQDFYIASGVNYTATAFDGCSDYGPFLDVGIAAGGLFTGAEEIKTAEDVVLFGGVEGEAYDPNYHQAGDTIDNLALDAFLLNTKSIADSIATYATSLDSIPVRNATVSKRDSMVSARKARRSLSHAGHSHCNSRDTPAM